MVSHGDKEGMAEGGPDLANLPYASERHQRSAESRNQRCPNGLQHLLLCAFFTPYGAFQMTLPFLFAGLD